MPINGVCYCHGSGADGCEVTQPSEPVLDPSVLRATLAADQELMPGLFESVWSDWLRSSRSFSPDVPFPAAGASDPRLLTSAQRLSITRQAEAFGDTLDERVLEGVCYE